MGVQRRMRASCIEDSVDTNNVLTVKGRWVNVIGEPEIQGVRVLAPVREGRGTRGIALKLLSYKWPRAEWEV